MGVVAAIVVFFMTWWTVLFVVLPFGLKYSDKTEMGAMHGAPDKPDFKKIILRTTVISLFIWTGIFCLASSNLISFQRMANDMQDTPQGP